MAKRRFQTTSRRVVTEKTEEFSSTGAEAYDLAVRFIERCFGAVRCSQSTRFSVGQVEFVVSATAE